MEALYFICIVFTPPPPQVIAAMITFGQSLSTPIKELHLTDAVQGLCH